MKKFAALFLSLCLICLSVAALADAYTVTYDITNDFTVEDEDTGERTLSFPETPLGESNVAVGYAGSFGDFVDTVAVDATLDIDGDTYMYTIAVHCGSDACALGNYSPVFTWSGKVLETADGSIKVAAPEHATVTILAAGQFATNEEQVGYFGCVDYTADETTTDCPYAAVPSGERLLGMFTAGTFTVADGAITGFVAD